VSGGAERDRLAAPSVGVDELADQRVELARFKRLVGAAARKIQELPDDRIQVLDVVGDGLAGGFVADRQLGFQAQAGERGAQVVRKAGQDFGALAVHAFQSSDMRLKAAASWRSSRAPRSGIGAG